MIVTLRPDGVVQRAGFALDGDARIVRDFLAAAGQRIEQRGLAAVRGSDQSKVPCQVGRDIHMTSDQVTRMAIASRRRSATVAMIDAHRDGIAPERAFVQNLHGGAFDEAQFDQRRSSSSGASPHLSSETRMASMRPRKPASARPSGERGLEEEIWLSRLINSAPGVATYSHYHLSSKMI